MYLLRNKLKMHTTDPDLFDRALEKSYCDGNRGCTEVHFDNGQMSDVLMHSSDYVKLFGPVQCDFRSSSEKTEAVCAVKGGEQGKPLQGKVTKVYGDKNENNWGFETHTDKLKITCEHHSEHHMMWDAPNGGAGAFTNTPSHVSWDESKQVFRCGSKPTSPSRIEFDNKMETTDECLISDRGGINIDYYTPTSGDVSMGVVAHNSAGNVECEMNGDAKIKCNLDEDAWMNACHNHSSWSHAHWYHECVAVKNKTTQRQTVTHTCVGGVWSYLGAPGDYPNTREKPPLQDAPKVDKRQLYCVDWNKH